MSHSASSRAAVTARAASVAVVATALVLIAGPAQAHVTVTADDAQKGAADSTVTFRVPNEEAKATTTTVEVTFPVKDPLASIKPAAKAGWTATVKPVTFNPPITTDDGTMTTGVGSITWTAKSAADAIPVGSFDTFSVLVGPLSEKADSIAFPTVQTYSDGTSVAWIEPTAAGGTEPEHPAPELKLTAAESAATPAAGSDAAPAASQARFATESEVSTARTLGILGLVLGALGLLGGGFAVTRTRRAA